MSSLAGKSASHLETEITIAAVQLLLVHISLITDCCERLILHHCALFKAIRPVRHASCQTSIASSYWRNCKNCKTKHACKALQESTQRQCVCCNSRCSWL